jgi:CheY-like chemotaxis protein
MQVRALDINAIVMDMDQLLRRTLGEDIELVTVLGEGIGTVEADAGLLEQVVINLAVNARDAMPKGGKLTIETSAITLDEEFCQSRVGIEPGKYALLSVRDIGGGMSKEVQDHAFEPFFTTKEKGKGTGLGLSTVYGIVKQCNGYVELESELDVGTNICIYLPTIERPAEELPMRGDASMPRGTETILVVEDEDTVRHLTVRMLKSLGYHVLEARHGGEALLICERYKEPIHLVLTDVVMPHVGGREMMKRLQEIRNDFKILYTSGFTEDRILDHGVVGKDAPLLVKPYTSEAMAQKVRSVLDS